MYKVLVSHLMTLDLIMIFGRVVLFQTVTHTFVVVSVAEFWAAIEMSQFLQAFVVFSIACSAAVEQVQAHKLALVLGFLFEHNC